MNFRGFKYYRMDLTLKEKKIFFAHRVINTLKFLFSFELLNEAWLVVPIEVRQFYSHYFRLKNCFCKFLKNNFSKEFTNGQPVLEFEYKQVQSANLI